MCSREARLAGRIAASIPARMAMPMNTTSVPYGHSEDDAVLRQRGRREHGEEHADADPERRADQRGDDALVPDHAADLAAGHADGAEHAELAGAFEDR